MDDEAVAHSRRQGTPGAAVHETDLTSILNNVLYVGKVSHQDVIYAGEQAPIIEDTIWKPVNNKPAHEYGTASITGAAQASEIARRRSAAIAAPAEPVSRITRLLALALKLDELGPMS